jgi:hypothetical protein
MEEPFSATVVEVLSPAASTEKPSMTVEGPARVISTPFGISAMVSLMPMLSAKDTPTPVDEADTPVLLGSALTMLSVTLSASMLTPPPVSVTLVVPGVSSAWSRPTMARVSVRATLTATEPATLVAASLAPEIACAPELCTDSTNLWPLPLAEVRLIAVPANALSRDVASLTLPSSPLIT